MDKKQLNRIAKLSKDNPIYHWLVNHSKRLRNHSSKDSLNFGSLRRLTPISQSFGYDRGLPIDRYYIENFLYRQAHNIRGHVMEIGEDSYIKRFGGERVTNKDILHVESGNPIATIVGDLTSADHIPSDTYDCIILTQTLQFIYDVLAALKTLHRILKPSGVLLTTFPGISQIPGDRWGLDHCWNFTTLLARRLFEEVFQPTNISVEAFGNVLTTIAFLQGLAVGELQRNELEYQDCNYELLITVRAVKSEEVQ